MTASILVVDDDRGMGAMLYAALRKKGYHVLVATSGDEALDNLANLAVDVVVTDLNMPNMNGLDLCARIASNRPDIPVVVITAFGSLETAVAAIRAGAYDFITKPFEVDVLCLALARAVEHRALREEVKRLKQVVGETSQYEELIGDSPAMKRVCELLDRIADTDASVLVTGESGTGKEVVAKAIHRRSRRSKGAFMAVNCSAIPEALLESELFGHAKGAFTDAKTARKGLFSLADGGTLFLDEIGELPMALQPKLLRALQERSIRPVGSDTESKFDVRVIAATNRDLETAIEERRFREDLFYRLEVIHLELPPLRSRGSDVLLLAQHFIVHLAEQSGKKVTGLSPEAAARLVAYSWPGNVRELQNCIERAIVLARFEQLTVDDLPDRIRTYSRSHVLVAADDPSELAPMEEVERRYVLRVMEAVRGNKTLAAQVLQFDRKTLYRKLEKYRYSEAPKG